MKETGIIMSGNHPKLILEGYKTQTRRVITPQPITDDKTRWWHWKKVEFNRIDFKTLMPLYCPFGQVGDSLWVKETWYNNHGELYYKADWAEDQMDYVVPKWQSSLFMPRWVSRLTLGIKEIRVQKLQEIELIDIEDEGIIIPDNLMSLPNHKGKYLAIQQLFIDLWDSLNAKRGYSWAENPWVWCISFKVVKQ